MTTYRHLNNAPIKESVIDLRFSPKIMLKDEDISFLKDRLREKYPKCQEMRLFEGGFGVKEGKPIVAYPEDKGINGYLFKSEDEKSIAQFRKDGFTFNRLRPYTYWEEVIKEAKSLWDLYMEKYPEAHISRIAVRYINQLDIPLPIGDFEEYLTKPPDVPEGVPQAVSAFLCRVVVHDTEQDIDANIVQALERSMRPGFANIILDIDVYKSVDLGVEKSEQIWVVFEKMREMKNRIFFGSITEKTARLFE